MRTGLHYGIAETYFKEFTKRKNQTNSDGIALLIKAFKYTVISKTNAEKFTNKHRYVKCLLLENEIYLSRKSIEAYMDSIRTQAIKENAKELLELNQMTFDENLEFVEKLLNNSIYIDESYETFLEEKLRPWRKQHDK